MIVGKLLVLILLVVVYYCRGDTPTPSSTQSQSPTASPTEYLYSQQVTVYSGQGELVGSSFQVSGGQRLHAEFSPAVTDNANIDVDLYLDYYYGAWAEMNYSASGSNLEHVDYNVPSNYAGYYFRWRLRVYNPKSSGQSIVLTFKTNIDSSSSSFSYLTAAPTLSPTVSPTAYLYSQQVTVYSGQGELVGSYFSVSAGQYLHAEFRPVGTGNANIDVDLYLDYYYNGAWAEMKYSTSGSNQEYVDYNVPSNYAAYYFRWRLRVYNPQSSGQSIVLTFKTNVPSSNTFSYPQTSSPTTASPTAYLYSQQVTLYSGQGDLVGNSFYVSTGQNLHAEFTPDYNNNYAMDVDLYLEYKDANSYTWTQASSSASGYNSEKIDFTVPYYEPSYSFRWRLKVSRPTYSGQSIILSFKTSVASSSTFTYQAATSSPTPYNDYYIVSLTAVIVPCSIVFSLALLVAIYAYCHTKRTRVPAPPAVIVGEQQRLLP